MQAIVECCPPFMVELFIALLSGSPRACHRPDSARYRTKLPTHAALKRPSGPRPHRQDLEGSFPSTCFPHDGLVS